MTSDEQASGKYNINISGDMSHSQTVVGDYNTVTQKIGLTPQEAAQLRAVFAGLRSAVAEQAPPERREAALSEAGELEGAIVAERPDPGRVRRALEWFRDNAPQLVGAVTSVLVSPVVGKVVEGAGQAVAGQFRELAEDEG